MFLEQDGDAPASSQPPALPLTHPTHPAQAASSGCTGGNVLPPA